RVRLAGLLSTGNARLLRAPWRPEAIAHGAVEAHPTRSISCRAGGIAGTHGSLVGPMAPGPGQRCRCGARADPVRPERRLAPRGRLAAAGERGSGAVSPAWRRTGRHQTGPRRGSTARVRA